MRQAITWTNADPIQLCLYEALVGDELMYSMDCGLVTPYVDIDLGQHWLR